MSDNLVSLKEDVCRNNKNIEYYKTIGVLDFVMDFKDDADRVYFEPFIDKNYTTLGDIVSCSSDDIKEIYTEYFTDLNEARIDSYIYFLVLKLHEFGLVLKDEFKDFGLDDEFAAIKLDRIREFPDDICKILFASEIYTLGDLVSFDEGSRYIRGIGEVRRSQIFEYVKSVGLSINSWDFDRYFNKDKKLDFKKSLDLDVVKNNIRSSKRKDIPLDKFVKKYAFNKVVFNPFLEKDEFYKLSDVVSLTKEEAHSIISKYLWPDTSKVDKFLDSLLREIHNEGLVFKDEYKDIGLEDEKAAVLLRYMNSMPSGLSFKLLQGRVYILGELLDCDDFKKIRGIGEKYNSDLLEFIDKTGLRKSDNKIKDGMIYNFRRAGLVVLEDIFEDKYICNILYKNSIYTIDQLIKNKDKVLQIKELGSDRKNKLFEMMKLANIKFDEDENLSLEDKIKRIKEINKELEDRISKKEKMIEEYESLLLINSELNEKEKELDRKLDNISKNNKVFTK